MALRRWISEIPVEVLSSKFGLGPIIGRHEGEGSIVATMIRWWPAGAVAPLYARWWPAGALPQDHEVQVQPQHLVQAKLDVKVKRQDHQTQVQPQHLVRADMKAEQQDHQLVQPQHLVQPDSKAEQREGIINMDPNPLDVVIIALEEATTDVPWHKIDNLLKNKCPMLTLEGRAGVVNCLSVHGAIVISEDKCTMRIADEGEGSEWGESTDSD